MKNWKIPGDGEIPTSNLLIQAVVLSTAWPPWISRIYKVFKWGKCTFFKKYGNTLERRNSWTEIDNFHIWCRYLYNSIVLDIHALSNLQANKCSIQAILAMPLIN